MFGAGRHALFLSLLFLSLLLLTTASCGGEVDEGFLTGTWIHTGQVEATDPVTGGHLRTLRRDILTLSDDNSYTREYQSNIPGEEEEFSHRGRWLLRGRTLKLWFTREDSTLGKVKGTVEVLGEYSIRLDNRFYSRNSRPRNQRPDREMKTL
jgi:hypothetical protein